MLVRDAGHCGGPALTAMNGRTAPYATWKKDQHACGRLCAQSHKTRPFIHPLSGSTFVQYGVMRELITFAVGQAGNQISTAFWETILEEHGLNKDGVRGSTSVHPTWRKMHAHQAGICRQ